MSGDLYAEKNISPMLIGAQSEPFDDTGYIYELKLEGERCLAYLDPAGETELRNKRNVKMLPKTPELAGLHTHVHARCILDGELAVLVEGKPDFAQIQRRSLMSNAYRIELAAKHYPACFTAFDILYYKNAATNHLPLMERKARKRPCAHRTPVLPFPELWKRTVRISSRLRRRRGWKALWRSAVTVNTFSASAQRIG